MLFDFFGALGVKKEVIENAFDDFISGTIDEKELKLLYGTMENVPDIFKNDLARAATFPKITKSLPFYVFKIKLH